MLERANVVLVVVHGLFVAVRLLRSLRSETIGLIVRIVELAESVAELAAVYEELEAISQLGAGVAPARQRRDFGGIILSENRERVLSIARAGVVCPGRP